MTETVTESTANEYILAEPDDIIDGDTVMCVTSVGFLSSHDDDDEDDHDFVVIQSGPIDGVGRMLPIVVGDSLNILLCEDLADPRSTESFDAFVAIAEQSTPEEVYEDKFVFLGTFGAGIPHPNSNDPADEMKMFRLRSLGCPHCFQKLVDETIAESELEALEAGEEKSPTIH